MQYLESSPAAELKPHIKKLWFCSSPFHQTTMLNIPFSHHELVFNLCESHEIGPTRHRREALLDERVWLSGLQQTAFRTRSRGRHEMMGVIFKTGGLPKITREDISCFTNQFIDASLVFGSEVLQVADELGSAGNVQEKFASVNKFLRDKIFNGQDKKIPVYLDFAIHEMTVRDYNGRGKIGEISQACGVTNKSLVQAFRHHLGLSPLKFQHLVLITRALHNLAENPNQKLTELAFQLGFFDQSHFIRIFKRITSLTPSEYASIRRTVRSVGDAAHYVVQQG